MDYCSADCQEASVCLPGLVESDELCVACPGSVDTLVVNGSGELASLDGWTVTEDGGNGWVYNSGNSVDAIPGEFATSYSWAYREQVVDLLAMGYTGAELDTQPAITVGEYYRAIFNNNDLYTLTVGFEMPVVRSLHRSRRAPLPRRPVHGPGLGQPSLITVKACVRFTSAMVERTRSSGQVIMVHGWMAWRSASPSTRPHHAAVTGPAKWQVTAQPHAFVMMATLDRPAGSMATSPGESFTLPPQRELNGEETMQRWSRCDAMPTLSKALFTHINPSLRESFRSIERLHRQR